MGSLPIDACPFKRPFPESFSECPPYEAQAFEALTLDNVPLTPVWTCRHLAIGISDAGGTEHRYGRCVLGSATARLQWLKDQVQNREQALAKEEPAIGLA
jgi:hypothetical protein